MFTYNFIVESFQLHFQFIFWRFLWQSPILRKTTKQIDSWQSQHNQGFENPASTTTSWFFVGGVSCRLFTFTSGITTTAISASPSYTTGTTGVSIWIFGFGFACGRGFFIGFGLSWGFCRLICSRRRHYQSCFSISSPNGTDSTVRLHFSCQLGNWKFHCQQYYHHLESWIMDIISMMIYCIIHTTWFFKKMKLSYSSENKLG